MMKSCVYELLGVILKPRNSQKCNAVIGPIIRNERSTGKLEIDLGANDRGVPINHFIQSIRLKIDVVHRRFDHLFGVVRHFTLLKAVARNRANRSGRTASFDFPSVIDLG
jgi:hypothetical protein